MRRVVQIAKLVVAATFPGNRCFADLRVVNGRDFKVVALAAQHCFINLDLTSYLPRPSIAILALPCRTTRRTPNRFVSFFKVILVLSNRLFCIDLCTRLHIT